MAIIYSYPTVTPTADDLVLGTDINQPDKPTKNFSIQSIVDLIQGTATGLAAVLLLSNDAAQQSAVNFTNVQGTGTFTAGTFTDGTMTMASGVGTAFTSITSTDFAGNLTGVIKTGSTLQTGVTGVTQPVGTNNATLATTAFVMSKVDPSILTFVGTNGGNQTVNLAAQTFSVLGTANQIETAGTAQTLTIKFPTAGVTLPNGSVATTQAATDDSTKVATTAFVRDYDNTQDLDFIGDTGTSSVLLNSQTLDFEGTTNQVVTAVTAQKVKFNLPSSITIAGTYTGATFAGDLNGTVNTATTGVTQTANNNSTKIATTAYVDNSAGSKTLKYAGDTTGPFSLNLTNDDLEFNGDSNITITAATVTGNKGIVTVDLNNNVTITGTSKAGTFTTTAGTATWATTVLDGFTAITSDLFTGPLTGNASTASALFTAGTINMTSAAGATLGPTASAVTYTSGGNISLSSVLLASTVTSKLLTGISFSTGTIVAQTDTILQGIGKLQKQITDLPSGLDYIGTWSAAANGSNTGGTPDLTQASLQVPGQYYIVATAGAARPNGAATEPSEWKVGDWAIFSDAPNSRWEKIDNTSEVTTDGSGVAGTMPVWNNASELGSSQVKQSVVSSRTVTTIVDGGTGGDLTVQGNTLLGSASTDTINSVGVHTIDNQLILKKGLGVGASPDYGDTTDKVLTSGNGSANPPAWVNRSTWGYVESVSGGTGITVSGTAIDPVVNIDYLGTDNIILSAGTAVTPVGADTIIINDATTGNAVKALISGLPFDAYSSWTADSDEGTNITVTSGFNLKFKGAVTAGGAGIATDSAVSANEMTIGLINAGGTPGATTFYRGDGQWSVPVGTKTETLAEVLTNGNTTGGTDIAVSVGDDITMGSTSKLIYSNALQIYRDGNTGYIKGINGDVRITNSSNENIFRVNSNSAELYYADVKKFETTSAGVTVTGGVTVIGALSTSTSASIGTTLTTGGSITVATHGLLSIIGGNNLTISGTAASHAGLSFATQAVLPATVSATNNGIVDLGANGNQFKDLYLSGNVIHGGSGIGTKGGTFTKLFTSISGGSPAFTIDRASTGAMVFDVMLTSDTSSTTSIAKKYTVVATYGTTDPIYNKILDTGPDASGADFTVVFAADGTSNTKIKCTITPVTTATQKIGITIDLGFGQNDATVVMNA